MASPATLLPFDEFKDMRVSDAASRLDVDLYNFWSILIQQSAALGKEGSTAPLLSQATISGNAPAPLIRTPGAPALSIASLRQMSASSSTPSPVDPHSQNLELLSPESLRAHISTLESHVTFFKQRLVEVEPSDELLLNTLPQRSVDPKRTATYTEAVLEWKTKGVRTLSDEIVKESAAGAVAYLGPLTASLNHYEEQIMETTDAIAKCDKSTNLRLTSRLYKRLRDLREGGMAKKRELDNALLHLQHTTWASAQALASRLDDDRRHYAIAMDLMAAADPGVLEEINALAAELHNVGALKAGAEARVVDNGQLARVRVERVLENDEYEVAFWNTVDLNDTKFEEGFSTSNRRVGTLKRCDIFADKKQRQSISEDLLRATGIASASEISSKDPTFLMLVYADAESSLQRLRRLCERLEVQVPGATAIVPTSLKKIARVSAKVLDKYGGDFSKITDIARSTMKCPSLAILLEVLRKLKSDPAFRLVLIKNRLMPEYNADEAGGYRDMLLNLVDAESGHIVELQLTMVPLLEVKMHGAGGHVAYNVARILNLFDESVNVHKGALTENVFKGVESGLLRVLESGGQATALGENFDRLLSAARSKYCGLVKVRLDDVGWPANRQISELLEALWTYGEEKLEYLWINDTAVTGSVPPDLFDRLPKLRTIRLPQTTALAGPIPTSLVNAKLLEVCIMNSMGLCSELSPLLGQLKNLQRLDLCENLLFGSIPGELGQLQNLHILNLRENRLGGTLPSQLGQLVNLKELYLYQNKLTGVVPSEFGQLRNLEVLNLFHNQLSGPLPSELGQLQNLKELRLNHNKFIGAVPSELGLLLNLQVLSLRENLLSEAIPFELGRLKNLVELRLNQNAFSGSLPSELGQLHNLQILHLQNNQLEGPIPSQLSKLCSVKELALDSNKLTGGVPKELIELPNFAKVWLGKNELSGGLSQELEEAKKSGPKIYL